MPTALDQKLNALQSFSACDVSDALLKIQERSQGTVIRAGYLPDLIPFAPLQGRNQSLPKIIAPASTFKFISKSDTLPDLPNPEANGFPPGKHWVDWAEPGTIAVLEQPQGQFCAVLGGIMATRMSYLGVKGVVVNGRVRDLGEICETKLPVWALATSTVGTSAEAKPAARNVPVSVGGVQVSPGDIIFCDPFEGVVTIPRDQLDQVLELMPKLAAMDSQVKEAVAQGETVADAFKKFRV